MSGTRVLVVDDEPRFRRTLALSLQGHGYEVKESETAAEALADFATFNPEVVLLDLMLPDRDGISVCRDLRSHSAAAIIVLSVIGEEASKVRALDEGADDYLTKPFGQDELLARMRSAVRRARVPGLTSELAVGGLRILTASHQVFLDGEEIRLTPTEFGLLELLVQNAGRVLRHPAILRTVWGPEYENDTQVLRTFINQLREKLHDDDRRTPRFIRTEPGVGYRFLIPL